MLAPVTVLGLAHQTSTNQLIYAHYNLAVKSVCSSLEFTVLVFPAEQVMRCMTAACPSEAGDSFPDKDHLSSGPEYQLTFQTSQILSVFGAVGVRCY